MDVDEALDEIESMIRGDFDPEKPEKFGPILGAFRTSRSPVTGEQHLRLIGIAIQLLTMGYPSLGPLSTLEEFSELLFDSGYRTTQWTDQAKSVNPKKYEKRAIVYELALEFLKSIGLINSDNQVEIIEPGSIDIGHISGRFRYGVIVLVRDRIYVVGKDYPHDRSCYILYPDLEEKSYYGSLDYIDLDKVDKVEKVWKPFHKKVDLWSDRIEYLRTTPRHLYGPLFFKIRMPDKTEIQRGEFRVQVRPEGYKDKNVLKEKLEILEATILEHVGALKSS
jgi:hypothetical protein